MHIFPNSIGLRPLSKITKKNKKKKPVTVHLLVLKIHYYVPPPVYLKILQRNDPLRFLNTKEVMTIPLCCFCIHP